MESTEERTSAHASESQPPPRSVGDRVGRILLLLGGGLLLSVLVSCACGPVR